MRRIERLSEVMDTADFLGVLVIQLDDDLVRQAADRGEDTDTRGRYDLTVFGDISSFDDSDVDLAEEAIAELLSEHREVHIKVGVLTGVDAVAHILVRLVGRAELNCTCASQCAVETVARAGTSEHTYLEWAACSVLFFGALSDSSRYDLGATCGGKAAETNVVAVLYECGCFVSCDELQSHDSSIIVCYLVTYLKRSDGHTSGCGRGLPARGPSVVTHPKGKFRN